MSQIIMQGIITFPLYSGPCDSIPLYLTIPCILRLDISDTTRIYSE